MVAAISVLSLGCPMVQDLGDQAVSKDAGPGGLNPTHAPTTPETTSPVLTESSCPVARPEDGVSCKMMVGKLCPYAATAYGCAPRCVCATDGRWVCFETGCTTFTTTSCTEGTPCSQSSRCRVPGRDCKCASGSRLHCTDGPAK